MFSYRKCLAEQHDGEMWRSPCEVEEQTAGCSNRLCPCSARQLPRQSQPHSAPHRLLSVGVSTQPTRPPALANLSPYQEHPPTVGRPGSSSPQAKQRTHALTRAAYIWVLDLVNYDALVQSRSLALPAHVNCDLGA
jgi:hypothetical protein